MKKFMPTLHIRFHRPARQTFLLAALVVCAIGLAVPQSFGALAQQAYVKASNPGDFDRFGTVVAISGDTMIVAAENESSNATGVNGNQNNNSAFTSGAAYLYVRTGTNWAQQAYLKASDSAAGFRFGHAVAIDGNTVVVGAPGVADGKLGAAYVFVRNGATWTEQARLRPSNDGGDFGATVSVSGDTIVIGAWSESSGGLGVGGSQSPYNSVSSGAAYVFVRSGVTWSQQAYLKASNAGAGDEFGLAVGVSGDTVVVGAHRESSNATTVNGNEADNSSALSGAAYVFFRTGATWTQQSYLKPANTGAGDFFGTAVAVSGNTILVGAPQEDSSTVGSNGDPFLEDASSSGAAYVFVRNGTTWSQQAYLKASNTGAGDRFGDAVAVDGDRVVVGARGEDSNGLEANNTTFNSGAAYLYLRLGVNWSQQAYLKAQFPDGGFYELGSGDAFGTSVGISGGTAVAGAPNESSNATGVNGNQSNNSLSQAGAAYVFTFTLAPVSGYTSLPAPGSRLDLGLVPGTTSRSLSLYFGKAGPAPLQISSISFVTNPANAVIHVTPINCPPTTCFNPPFGDCSVGFPLVYPAGPSAGFTHRVDICWNNTGTAIFGENLDQILRVVCDDPARPVIEYRVFGTDGDLFESTPEGTIINLLNQLGGPSPLSGGKGRKSLSPNATFVVGPDPANTVTTQIPAHLGGGSVTLSNFAGSFSISTLPIPGDTNRVTLRVESGTFTAPSFTLPSGLASGPNVLTFGPPEQSSGFLYLTNGHYEVTATATITNNLIPDGVTVRGNYTGTYNAATGQASLQSASEDLFVPSERVQLNHASNGLWLTWANTNAVEEATDVTGPWRTVTNAASPYLVITTNLPQQFFRLRLPQP